MAHNIQVYMGKESAWHQLGTVTGRYFSWADICSHGGLDFQVFKSQLRDALGREVDAWGIFRWNDADRTAGKKDAAVFLGAVGKDYTEIQHRSGFGLVDALVKSTDGAHYVTAGVLGKGETVWGQADLGLTLRVGDDVQNQYLLFATSHDASMSYSLRNVSTRAVCANTIRMAMSEKVKAQLTVRHTKNAEQKIIDAKAILANMSDDVKKLEDRLNFLAGRKMTRESMTVILDKLFPKKEKESDGGELKMVSTTRRENILADVLKVYEINDGNAFPEQRGTAYNLLNAVTEYTDHLRTARNDGRAESAMFGSGDALKSQALEVITLAASTLPAHDMRPVYSVVTSTPPPPPSGAGLLDAIVAAAF